jgi:hypothetical protein
MKIENLEMERLKFGEISTIKHYQLDSVTPPHEAYLRRSEARMFQLRQYHMISQSYILPIPFFCQIYHLLNLKHLETVHGISLYGLKISNVSQYEATAIGGSIKFQTTLDPFPNLLRIWRHPVVEVELALHTPYTIELKIPLYRDGKIHIIFNILPLGKDMHELFIDIYSNLVFPKPILQILLHFASCLTLFEDMAYLHKLANRNFHSLIHSAQVSNQETMQLFNRFVDLYGSVQEQALSWGADELHPLSIPSC